MDASLKKAQRSSLMVEGRTKKIFLTNQPEHVLMEFKNDHPIGTGRKAYRIRGKAQVNTDISSYAFQFLESYQIPTHFIRKHDEKSLLVRRLEMIPLVVKVRNVATGEFARDFKLEEGAVLPAPIIEFYLKNSKLNFPFINEYHLYAFGVSNQDEVRMIQRLTAKVNAVLKNFCERRQFLLTSFSLEFGRMKDRIFVADEISLDTLQITEASSGRRLDREFAAGKESAITKLYTEMKARFILPRP